MKIHNTPPSDS